METGCVNRILPFSSVDGPGNRTVVFLQGCNFNCSYCHNPETINYCNNCGICLESCPTGALDYSAGEVTWDKNLCQGCDKCLQVCPENSSPKAREMTVDEVLNIIAKTRPFISGITVSGGEACLQSGFVTELFKEVKKLGLTTFLDTNGSIMFKEEPDLLKVMDMVMIDMKAYSQQEHLNLTGADNSNVLENISYLGSLGKINEVRTVIVPNLIDNKNNIDRISSLIAATDPTINYKLIKYRPTGVRLNLIDSCQPADKMMYELKKLAQDNGCQQVVVV